MKNNIIIWVLGFVLLIAACKKTPDSEQPEDTNGKDRQAMLTYLTDDVIIPSYTLFKTNLDVMLVASDSFTANPTRTNLVAFRNAWSAAYLSWQTVELFDFGPAETQTLRSFFNIYPADVNGINANFNNPAANLETPGAYAQQGFPAFDYLLNGVASTDTGCVAFYTDVTQGNKRRAYIQRISVRMKDLLNTVLAGWNGSYRETFISKTGLDISSSTSLMVNGIVMEYERYIRSGKFGIPSGAMLNGVVAPEKVEAFYKKDLSLPLAKAAHQAFVDFFNGKSLLTGTEGPSLKTYLNALGAKDGATGQSLTEILNNQFAVCVSKMNLLGPGLYNEVQNNNPAVVAVYNEMQAAVRMLKVDMTSAMSITITYTDNDGD